MKLNLLIATVAATLLSGCAASRPTINQVIESRLQEIAVAESKAAPVKFQGDLKPITNALLPTVYFAGPFPTNTTYPTNLPHWTPDTNRLWTMLTQNKTNFILTANHMTNGHIYYILTSTNQGAHWTLITPISTTSNSYSFTMPKAGLYAAGYLDAWFNVKDFLP